MAVKTRGKPMIVIRKEEVIVGGHHGGAWKVAYADFVTAMMAFFLLMWLLNATTEEQRVGLADYFSPNSLMARSHSGSGQPFGGTTPNAAGSLASDRGAMQVVKAKQIPLLDIEEDDSDVPATPEPVARKQTETGTVGPGTAQGTGAGAAGAAAGTGAGIAGAASAGPASAGATSVELRLPSPPPGAAREANRAERERTMFERAAEQIREAVRTDPLLAEIAKQLAIDITPEGLRIQIMDEDRRPMFPTGSAQMADRARALLAKVAPVLLRLPEQIAIDGHTDAAIFRGTDRTNWELSADRANATRRILVELGLPDDRFSSVTGHANRQPLIKDDPAAAANRRIAIMVLRRVAPPPVATVVDTPVTAPVISPAAAPLATPVTTVPG